MEMSEVSLTRRQRTEEYALNVFLDRKDALVDPSFRYRSHTYTSNYYCSCRDCVKYRCHSKPLQFVDPYLIDMSYDNWVYYDYVPKKQKPSITLISTIAETMAAANRAPGLKTYSRVKALTKRATELKTYSRADKIAHRASAELKTYARPEPTYARAETMTNIRNERTTLTHTVTSADEMDEPENKRMRY